MVKPFVIAWLWLGQTPTFAVSGTVTGATRTHPVGVLLWTSAEFLKTPSQVLVIAPGAPLTFQFEVAAGEWVVSAFEDENSNGKLDMGFFGPKEPSGFWRPYSAWRKPRYGDVGRKVEAPMTGVEIAID